MFEVDFKKYIEKFSNWKDTFSKFKKLDNIDKEKIILDLYNKNPISKLEAKNLCNFFIEDISNTKKDLWFSFFRSYILKLDTVIWDVAYLWLLELSLDKKWNETKLTSEIKKEFWI